MLGVLKYLPHLAVVVALSGGGWWAYSTIKQIGYAECSAALAKETAKRQEAEDERADAMRKREIAVRQAEEKLRLLEKELSNEAANDPMADDPGLGLGSLQRLNEIR